jgi:hypothetical protein
MRISASRLCITTSLVLAATVASAACEMPSMVRAIPDGTKTSEAELLQVQGEVQAYVRAMDDYIACTNEELTASGDDATAEFLLAMTTRIETARKEVDAVASDFNDQVVAFRAANRTGRPAFPAQPPGGFEPGDAQPGRAEPGNSPPFDAPGNPPRFND